MKIGVIGAGLMGAALARLFAGIGHTVKLANSRSPDTINDLASRMGAEAVGVEELVKDGEVVVLSIPQGAVEKLSAGLFDNLPRDAVLVDTGNYYPGLRDGTIDEIEGGTPESVWVSQCLGRPVVKAFNSISFTSLAGKGVPAGTPGRIALPVAGDDDAAKLVVARLIEDSGFDAVDAGSLSDTWRQQPGTPAYCTDLDKSGVMKALSIAERDSAPQRRDQFIAQMLEAMRAGESVDLTALSRSVYRAP